MRLFRGGLRALDDFELEEFVEPGQLEGARCLGGDYQLEGLVLLGGHGSHGSENHKVRAAYVLGLGEVDDQIGHAGLQERTTEDAPSIAWSTWPRGRLAPGLQESLVDCLRTLDALNRELNGEVPSTAAVRAAHVPRSVAYAITEIVRMIRDCQEQARDHTDAAVFGHGHRMV